MSTFEKLLVVSSMLTLIFDDILIHLEDGEVSDEEDVANKNCQEKELEKVAGEVRVVEPRFVLVHQHGTRDADHDLEEDAMDEV